MADFIFKRNYDATLEKLAVLPKGPYSNIMRVDGYGFPIDIAMRIDVADDHILADFEGTSPPSPKGINCPLSGLCLLRIEMLACAGNSQHHASLPPFRVIAPKDCI